MRIDIGIGQRVNYFYRPGQGALPHPPETGGEVLWLSVCAKSQAFDPVAIGGPRLTGTALVSIKDP
jgi:hypothetical protein